jgi:amino acid transporter
MNTSENAARRFGTAPVFITAISTILGAILFLRFGFATGTLGFWGVILIIIVGHLITLPTAMALSEIATNQKVEGGGEYYIISRSFGLNIGGTIGLSLYLSQAISVAFYVIAFTEAFEPLFNMIYNKYGFILPRQAISLPAMAVLSFIILKRGANLGVKALYLVAAVLFLSLILFFTGKTEYSSSGLVSNFVLKNPQNFFVVFAIVFPAFTGMTAGVGLSGDLKNPGKSIPLGTLSATVIGMFIYFLVVWKLSVSASPDDLLNEQLIMSKIALFGGIAIPLGLAASTMSSALGSILVAPRTLQALGGDKSFPSRRLNLLFSKGRSETNEPYNATVITCLIAFVFVALGDVNAVAQIITMFFLITYGSLSLISFLNHFGADPSYRPTFKSRWYFSLIGAVMSIWLMFKINTTYALVAAGLMVFIYLYTSNYHKSRKGLEVIFQGTIFQIARNLHVYLQKSKKITSSSWRPAVVCVSKNTFQRNKAFELINWISHRYGFATYIHLIEGYFSKASHQESGIILKDLIKLSESYDSKAYVDTLISPSYTSAIAQIIQLPSVSGMDNNLTLFEFDKDEPSDLKQIVDNYSLVKSGNFDICILGISSRAINYRNGIHVWIKPTDFENSNLMILLSYIILGHSSWKKGFIKIFSICKEDERIKTRQQLTDLIMEGQLPISTHNIEILTQPDNMSTTDLINEKSSGAGLTFIGFRGEQIKHDGDKLFLGYDKLGDILFVNANMYKEIK